MSAETQALLLPDETHPAPPTADPWTALREVPVRLSVDVELPPLSIRTLNELKAGTVLCSTVPIADDLPITIGGALVSWARFECTDGRMAMRITRLA